MSAAHEPSEVMSSFLRSPPIANPIETPTSRLQAATVLECLPFLNGLNSQSTPFDPFSYLSNGLLTLQRDEHVDFLHEALSGYPAPFVAMDAARPWMVYWALTALHLMGQDVTEYRDRVVKTFFPLQNSTGGYGGGQGHLSHLAGTYATILSLSMVGGDAAWSLTNRRSLWEWLGRLKQPDGGFIICEGGEEDARGAYCALVAISLLDLPWELPPQSPARRYGFQTFGDGLGEWLGRCQSYEGGIAAAPGNEAHGAYAFCAVACLCLLGRPEQTLRKYLDLDALIDWLSSRQYAPEGGLAGRTNKVVDGCYSQWLGGIWPLIQATIAGPQANEERAQEQVKNLYSAEGLARYILNCCQDSEGGLRDKPSKNADAYHSCYTLAGLSAAEYCHYLRAEPYRPERFAWAFEWEASRRVLQKTRNVVLPDPRHPASASHDRWHLDDNEANFDLIADLQAVHPVYVVPHHAAWAMRSWALQQGKVEQTPQ